jgi:hypothetical protein
MSKILVGVCAFVMLTLAPSVRADTVIITSGSFSTSGIFGGAFYTFTGSGFSLTGAGPGGFTPLRNCFPCTSGQTLGASDFVTGNGLGSGTVTINGVTQNVLLLGTLNLSAGTFTIPAVTTNVTLTGSFSLSGSIFGCPLAQAPFCAEGFNSVFSTQLAGTGTVVVHLNFLDVDPNGNSRFTFGGVTYTIGDSNVPEPVTVTLLATGVIGLAARLRFRRKRRSP